MKIKQSEAIEHIRALRRLVQRAQTSLREELPDPAMQDAAAALQPWLFGPTSLLDVTAKIEDMIDGGQQLRPLDFYNIMVIAQRIDPIIGRLSALLGAPSFPAPDIEWMGGWEDEASDDSAG